MKPSSATFSKIIWWFHFQIRLSVSVGFLYIFTKNNNSSLFVRITLSQGETVLNTRFFYCRFSLIFIHIKALFRFDHSMETSGNHWFSYQCRIQKLFWEAGFLTSVARRKTVLQLGGLGGGGCCKPSPVWSRGQSPGKFWLFSILWCSKSKQNTICQGFEIIADLDNYVKEPF